jgi:hypothetical protein
MVLTGLAMFCASGQELIQSGAVRVTLPSKEWSQTALPMAAKTDRQETLKFLLHAEAYQGQLKLHITQFDYPSGVTEERLAAFLDHIRLGYQQQAFGPVKETTGEAAGIPTVNLDIRYRGWNWMRARAFFCAKSVYLVEVGGQGEFQKQGDECWKGIAFAGETPLNADSFKKMISIREKNQATMLAQSQPPSKTGLYVMEIVALAGGILCVLWASVWLARKARSPGGLKLRLWGSGHRRRRRRSSPPPPPFRAARG